MPIETPDPIEEYVHILFAPEDAALSAVSRRQEQAGLPAINISPTEGKVIGVLLRAVGARRALEIGTLGGYSGIWIARALGEPGRLVTIEMDQRHATFARRSFVEAGVGDRVEIHEGSARDILPRLKEKFDAVFVDADKESYPFYYEQGMRLLRVGGLLLGDNAFRDGRVAHSGDRAPDVEAVREFNRLAANDPRLFATIIPVRDGLLVGVKLAD
ncbi:MAG: O-methyltransferase [Gemmatimonadetes bacterium]|nr:O-methyltransferase [Gemmatimonadota bacterium]